MRIVSKRGRFRTHSQDDLPQKHEEVFRNHTITSYSGVKADANRVISAFVELEANARDARYKKFITSINTATPLSLHMAGNIHKVQVSKNDTDADSRRELTSLAHATIANNEDRHE